MLLIVGPLIILFLYVFAHEYFGTTARFTLISFYLIATIIFFLPEHWFWAEMGKLLVIIKAVAGLFYLIVFLASAFKLKIELGIFSGPGPRL